MEYKNGYKLNLKWFPFPRRLLIHFCTKLLKSGHCLVYGFLTTPKLLKNITAFPFSTLTSTYGWFSTFKWQAIAVLITLKGLNCLEFKVFLELRPKFSLKTTRWQEILSQFSVYTLSKRSVASPMNS